jgi:hypothetical protein
MTAPTPTSNVQAVAGSRLDALLASYDDLKARADEAAERLKAVTDGIKAELTAATPGAQKIVVNHPALSAPLGLSYVERWDLDTKRMKAEDPATYVRYARKGGSWRLGRVQG